MTAGQKFGMLEVVDPEVRIPSAQKSRPGGWRAALCRCECGNEKAVRLNHLLTGSVSSCGCNRVAVSTKHGKARRSSRHPLYYTWALMMDRCHNPRSKDYPRYGASGVAVHPEWRDVIAFIDWIEANLGPRPDGRTLDRYPDAAGNYEPGNVRWATASEQQNNTRPLQLARLSGTTLEQRASAARALRDSGLTYKQIAAVMGVSLSSVSNYLRNR